MDKPNMDYEPDKPTMDYEQAAIDLRTGAGDLPRLTSVVAELLDTLAADSKPMQTDMPADSKPMQTDTPPESDVTLTQSDTEPVPVNPDTPPAPNVIA